MKEEVRKSKINMAPKKLLNTEIVYLVWQSKVADQFPPSSIFIQLFQKMLSEKICTRQSRKVMWDMINTQLLTVAFL